MDSQQGKQQEHLPPQIPPPNQSVNSPIRHNQFNQQFQQPPMPQVGPLMAPPQQYSSQIPPPYFHHYPPTNGLLAISVGVDILIVDALCCECCWGELL